MPECAFHIGGRKGLPAAQIDARHPRIRKHAVHPLDGRGVPVVDLQLGQLRHGVKHPAHIAQPRHVPTAHIQLFQSIALLEHAACIRQFRHGQAVHIQARQALALQQEVVQVTRFGEIRAGKVDFRHVAITRKQAGAIYHLHAAFARDMQLIHFAVRHDIGHHGAAAVGYIPRVLRNAGKRRLKHHFADLVAGIGAAENRLPAGLFGGIPPLDVVVAHPCRRVQLDCRRFGRRFGSRLCGGFGRRFGGRLCGGFGRRRNRRLHRRLGGHFDCRLSRRFGGDFHRGCDVCGNRLFRLRPVHARQDQRRAQRNDQRRDHAQQERHAALFGFFRRFRLGLGRLFGLFRFRRFGRRGRFGGRFFDLARRLFENLPGGEHQLVDVILKLRAHRVDPVHRVEVIPHVVGQLLFRHAERQNDPPHVRRKAQFLEHRRGGQRAVRQNQQINARVADGRGQLARIIAPRHVVALVIPAADTRLFQIAANRVRQRFVVVAVTDENVMCHFVHPFLFLASSIVFSKTLIIS